MSTNEHAYSSGINGEMPFLHLKRAHNKTTNLLNGRQFFALLTQTHTNDATLEIERNKRNQMRIKCKRQISFTQ